MCYSDAYLVGRTIYLYIHCCRFKYGLFKYLDISRSNQFEYYVDVGSMPYIVKILSICLDKMLMFNLNSSYANLGQ